MPFSMIGQFSTEMSSADANTNIQQRQFDAQLQAQRDAPGNAAALIAAVANAKNANPTDIEKQQVASLTRSNDIAQALWTRYQNVYQPLQDQIINDSKTVDSQENQDRAAGTAHADVTSNYNNAAQQNIERLRSMGVNPDSGAFIEANTRLAGSQGAADAGAQNTARLNLQNVGRQYRLGVAGVGSSMPQQAMTGLTAAGNGLGSAASGVQATNTSQNKALGSLLAPMVGGVKDWINGKGILSQGNDGWGGGLNNNQIDQWNTNNNNDASSFSPSSNDDGWYADGGVVRYADGGEVDGPGTGTSDSIPVAVKGVRGYGRAYLSDGEVVIPTDVVKAKGVEFFNKLIEKYHTPVRRGVRR